MFWSKAKRIQAAEETQAERKDEPEQLDNAHKRDSDEAQYPGLKILLPTVLSVCLGVFLPALVYLLSRLLKTIIWC